MRHTPVAEVVVVFELARHILVCDFQGVMLPVIEEAAELVRHGSAVQQVSAAIEYAEFAVRSNGLVRHVFVLCSDLLWNVEPCERVLPR